MGDEELREVLLWLNSWWLRILAARLKALGGMTMTWVLMEMVTEMSSRMLRMTMAAKAMAGLLKTTTLICLLTWRQAYQRLLQQVERRMDTLQRLLGEPLHLNSGLTTPHFLWIMCLRVIWSLRAGSYMTRLVLSNLVHTNITSYPHFPGLPPVSLDFP